MNDAMAVFKVGELYSSNEIQTYLGVGNAGGVRLSLNPDKAPARMVVLTSVAEERKLMENPYHDRIEGDTLVYTGTGREGDQALAGINIRIPQQVNLSFPIYAFSIIGSRRNKRIGPKRWMFLGLLEYLRHYADTQIDSRHLLRKVWLFEFRIHSSMASVSVSDEKEMFSALRMLPSSTLSASEDRQVTTNDEVIASNATSSPVQVEEERSRLLGLAPVQFEHIIRHVLLHTGFEHVAVTRYSQDGGVDVLAHVGSQSWPIRNMLVQVQAKRWLHTVGRSEVAELRGSLQPYARGALVTTSHFSKAAINEAVEVGKNPIVLIDGHEFAQIFLSLAEKRIQILEALQQQYL